jgi:hypothetical protein
VRKSFVTSIAAVTLFTTAAIVSPRAETLTITAKTTFSQPAHPRNDLVYVGAKTRAFVGCYSDASEANQDRRYKFVLACMKTRGYAGWCMKNSMCFEAERLDTLLEETIARLL